MGRGSTGLENYEYDNYLSKNKKERELKARKDERKAALKKDLSGYSFGIDKAPVKVSGIQSFREELKKRGLAIADEAKKDPKWSIEENAKREQANRDKRYNGRYER